MVHAINILRQKKLIIGRRSPTNNQGMKPFKVHLRNRFNFCFRGIFPTNRMRMKNVTVIIFTFFFNKAGAPVLLCCALHFRNLKRRVHVFNMYVKVQKWIEVTTDNWTGSGSWRIKVNCVTSFRLLRLRIRGNLSSMYANSRTQGSCLQIHISNTYFWWLLFNRKLILFYWRCVCQFSSTLLYARQKALKGKQKPTGAADFLIPVKKWPGLKSAGAVSRVTQQLLHKCSSSFHLGDLLSPV